MLTGRTAAELEHIIVSNVSRFIPQSVKDFWVEYRAALKQARTERHGTEGVDEAIEMAGWGVEEAQVRNQAGASKFSLDSSSTGHGRRDGRADRGDAGLGTQLALAYAIHKSFIFLRVPLAAAVTPKVVKVLRGWGWKIGKRRT